MIPPKTQHVLARSIASLFLIAGPLGLAMAAEGSGGEARECAGYREDASERG